MKQILLAGLVAFGLASSAQAALIGVAFDNSNPNGIPTNWHDVTSNGTFMNLSDEDGNASSVDFMISGYVDLANTTPGASTIPSHTNSLANLNTYAQPHLVLGSHSAVFSGLNVNSDYNVWVFGLRGFEYFNDWTISGTTSTSFTQTGLANQLTVNSQVGSSAQTLASYAITLKPSALGEISFDLTAADANFGRVAGFAIEEVSVVPEPSNFALLGIGGIALVGYGWRRKQQQAA